MGQREIKRIINIRSLPNNCDLNDSLLKEALLKTGLRLNAQIGLSRDGRNCSIDVQYECAQGHDDQDGCQCYVQAWLNCALPIAADHLRKNLESLRDEGALDSLQGSNGNGEYLITFSRAVPQFTQPKTRSEFEGILDALGVSKR